MRSLITNAKIVNEGKTFSGDLLIDGDFIYKVISKDDKNGTAIIESFNPEKIIDATGKHLIPGVIDDQVHFRDFEWAHKAEIYTESKAAVAGGVTSYMDMPNTAPQALTQELLEKKYVKGAEASLANYSFYMGTSNDNLEEILKTDPNKVCGIKIFLGASTGNMLVDNKELLEAAFAMAPCLIATHCEDEPIIRAKIDEYKEKYGEDIPIEAHPEIRSEAACFKSSSFVVNLAKKHNTRLHVLHLTTAKEMELFDNSIPLEEKRITAEICVHHMWFSKEEYAKLGSKIKCNPAIKNPSDRDGLFQAMLDNKLDVIATDHAPHLMEEKDQPYLKSAAGLPLVQHSLYMMLDFYKQGKISLERVVEKMCHAPAICFQVKNRGFIREGYYADLALIDMDSKWTVDKSNVLYKCGWSPLEGHEFKTNVTHTFINGNLVYENGNFDESTRGMRLEFDRV